MKKFQTCFKYDEGAPFLGSFDRFEIFKEFEKIVLVSKF